MKTILIVTYYGLIESIKRASEALERKGYTIVNYPLFRYYMDEFDRIDNYKDHMIDYINKYNPDLILWWYFNIPLDSFREIILRTNGINMLYNWDDPWCWYIDEELQFSDKIQYFDVIGASCMEMKHKYIENGCEFIYLPPGYDKKDFHKLDVENYECDVSICITNLYDDKQLYKDEYQYINRKELVDNLSKDESIKFNLYGPEIFKEIYPKNYKRFVKYDELNEVFNRSKININLHLCYNHSKYVNERDVLMLGSECLVMGDPVKDNEELNNSIIILDKNDYMKQIREVLKDYGIYKERNNNKELYTWDEWANKIHKYLCNVFFDKEFYMNNYVIPIKNDNYLEYYNMYGYKEGHVTFGKKEKEEKGNIVENKKINIMYQIYNGEVDVEISINLIEISKFVDLIEN